MTTAAQAPRPAPVRTPDAARPQAPILELVIDYAVPPGAAPAAAPAATVRTTLARSLAAILVGSAVNAYATARSAPTPTEAPTAGQTLPMERASQFRLARFTRKMALAQTAIAAMQERLPHAIVAGPDAMQDVVRQLGGVPLLLSGASPGADTEFGEAAMRLGHEVAHFLGPNNEPSPEATQTQTAKLLDVSDDVLEGEAVGSVFRKTVHTRFAGDALDTADEDWKDSRRNVLQVMRADVVYAVAYRSLPEEGSPALDIGGGTGFACECYANRFRGDGGEDPSGCRLYLFDDGDPNWPGCLKDPLTHRKWSRWDSLQEVWSPLEGAPPTPSGVYAGIGSTRLTEWGVRAIHELMAVDAHHAAMMVQAIHRGNSVRKVAKAGEVGA